jgi:hypothetical protein
VIHARKDYNRIQDPALEDPSLLSEGSSPIGENEPVMLFRAQDKHFIQVLASYRTMLYHDFRKGNMSHDELQKMDRALSEHIVRADGWRKQNGAKTPDMPKE